MAGPVPLVQTKHCASATVGRVRGTRVTVQLSEELLARLDERAAREGRSRSALTGDAIEALVPDEECREEERKRISREIVEGYERIPQVADEPW